MSETTADARAKRDSVFRTAVIVMEDGRRTECRVRNMSPNGVGVSHRGELRSGMVVRIAIGRQPEVDATVVWATSDQGGVAFGTAPKGDVCDPGTAMPVVQAGWMAEIDDPYRK